MLAPIDARVEYEAGGDTITLRLNFRSIALLETHGLDLFSTEGVSMTLAKSATMLRCLAVSDHPKMTDDQALAYIVKGKTAFAEAVLELLAKFGGEGEADEGNAPAAKAA